jgi:threonine dehydratase
VLAGFEVPRVEMSEFEAFLETLGYRYQREAENPAYRQFLGTDARN